MNAQNDKPVDSWTWLHRVQLSLAIAYYCVQLGIGALIIGILLAVFSLRSPAPRPYRPIASANISDGKSTVPLQAQDPVQQARDEFIRQQIALLRADLQTQLQLNADVTPTFSPSVVKAQYDLTQLQLNADVTPTAKHKPLPPTHFPKAPVILPAHAPKAPTVP